MLRRGRRLAVLCIFVLVVAALLAPATGAAHAAGILVPLAPLFGLVVISAVRPDDDPLLHSFVPTPPLPTRAPPRSWQLSTNRQEFSRSGAKEGSLLDS